MTDTDIADHYRSVTANVAPSVDPAAAADVACFMTTDTVDADDEIVLPSGADLSRFEKNPVLLLCHGYGQPGSHHPLPIGRVLGTKKRPNGILAQVKFAESTAMGRDVKALFREGMFRSFSIGFRSLEASPLTREEANSRPDWKAAFERTRGRINVIRKWLLLELSAVPLPANPDALVASYKALGRRIPSWLDLSKHPEGRPMSDEEQVVDDGAAAPAVEDPPAAEVETKAACACGKADCPRCGTREKAKDDESDPDEPEPDDDTDDDGGSAEGAGFRRGDHVRVRAPHYKGVGEVQGVYRKGHVPHVGEDVKGTDASPAARVKCYKAMGDGHVPTGDHVGVMCKHLTKLAEPMQGPTKKGLASVPAVKAVRFAVDDGRLPPLDVLSEGEMQRRALEAIDNATAVATAAAVAEQQRLNGCI